MRRLESIRIGLTLVPFAGIAFLWFVGVIRDLLGDLEDRFPAWVLGISVLILLRPPANDAVGRRA
jgi:hypothetical protein